MNGDVIIRILKKIHLTIVDAKYVASEILNSTTKSIVSFFVLFFLVSLTISAITRTAKIVKYMPETLVSAVGVLEFNNYKLTTTDTIQSVDGWKLKELITLISGVRVSQSYNYPVTITIGTDSINTKQGEFINIGKTSLSTNIWFNQNVPWTKILPKSDVTADADFYKTQLSNILNQVGIFWFEFIVISSGMIASIFQIWLSIIIYLLLFGRKINIIQRFRLVMLTTIPYFIIMPVSFAAANGISFTTDMALIAGLIITFRVLSQIDSSAMEGKINEAR